MTNLLEVPSPSAPRGTRRTEVAERTPTARSTRKKTFCVRLLIVDGRACGEHDPELATLASEAGFKVNWAEAFEDIRSPSSFDLLLVDLDHAAASVHGLASLMQRANASEWQVCTIKGPDAGPGVRQPRDSHFMAFIVKPFDRARFELLRGKLSRLTPGISPADRRLLGTVRSRLGEALNPGLDTLTQHEALLDAKRLVRGDVQVAFRNQDWARRQVAVMLLVALGRVSVIDGERSKLQRYSSEHQRVLLEVLSTLEAEHVTEDDEDRVYDCLESAGLGVSLVIAEPGLLA